MSIRVDFERRHITASVRALCEPPEASGRATGGVAALRAALGREVHHQYRTRRPDEVAPHQFDPEVAIHIERTASPATRGFSARIQGRADGVVRAADPAGSRLWVEEVKSVAMDAQALAQTTLAEVPSYADQARLYAIGLAAQYPEWVVEARLILVSVVDDSERILELEFDRASAHQALDARLCAAIEAAEAVRAQAERRRAAADRLVFPYQHMRPQQETLMAEFERGLRSARPVLAAAPTGVGKTVSALLAGLRHALSRGSSLHYATAKNTLKPHVAATFEDLTRTAELAPGELSAVTLRAKDRMCPPQTLACHPEHCAYLRDYGPRSVRAQAVPTLRAQAHHVTPEAIFERGQALELCPFELALELAAQADLVICDYNHIYDRRSALALTGPDSDPTPDHAQPTGPAPDESPGPFVIVDEVHNLPDRARGYHSPRLRRATLDRARQRLADGFYRAQAGSFDPDEYARERALSNDLGDLFDQLDGHIDAAYEGPARAGHGLVDDTTPVEPEPATWQGLAERAARLLLRFALHCRLHRLVFPRDPLVEVLRAVMHIAALLESDQRTLIPYASGLRAPGGASVGVQCVDPAPALARRHRALGGLVAMSATLFPLEHHREVLGLSALAGDPAVTPITLALPPPFPVEHRCVVVVPTVHTSARERDRDGPAIERLIEDIIAARPGRYAAYFSSFAFLTRIRAQLSLPPQRLLVQTSEMPLALRKRMLERLRGQPGPALMLAVLGGIFAEGIDLPGDALIGSIIVGPGLPGISFERAAMRAYFDERDGTGFARAMLYPGMQRVIQAAGRVIRRDQDRGVIALLGARFAEPGYLECLPPDWYAYRPEELVTDDPGPHLAEFWRHAGVTD